MSGSATFIGLPPVTGSLREESLGGLPGLVLVLPGPLLSMGERFLDGGFYRKLLAMVWLGVLATLDLLSSSGWIIL